MDRRTKRQKLEAMANQSVSPHEAAVARQKLADLPPDPPSRASEFWRLTEDDRTERVVVRVWDVVSIDDILDAAFDDLFDDLIERAMGSRIYRDKDGNI